MPDRKYKITAIEKSYVISKMNIFLIFFRMGLGYVGSNEQWMRNDWNIWNRIRKFRMGSQHLPNTGVATCNQNLENWEIKLKN